MTDAKPQNRKEASKFIRTGYLMPQDLCASNMPEGPKDLCPPQGLCFFLSLLWYKKAQMSSLMHSELNGVELNPNSIHWALVYTVPYGKWGIQRERMHVPCSPRPYSPVQAKK